MAPKPAAAPEHDADRDLLIAAAEDAGQIALKYFEKDFDQWEKSDGMGPVTQADLEIDAMLSDRLQAARPGYGWLSEETEDGTARLSAQRVFIVDPIDGTRAFINGEKGFAVSVAVAEHGIITAACVHLPARDETYAAALGAGATRNGRPIAASVADDLSTATILTSRTNMDEKHWPGGVPPLNRTFRPSLAWRMCLVAEGRFDAMVTFRDTFEWDIAAGALICSEAGVAVGDGQGAPFAFNSPAGVQPGTMIAAPALMPGILAHRLGRQASGN